MAIPSFTSETCAAESRTLLLSEKPTPLIMGVRPKRRKPRVPVLDIPMDVTTGWSTDSRCTIALDTTYWRAAGTAGKSIKSTKSTTVDTYYKLTKDYGLGTELNLTSERLIHVRVYIPSAAIADRIGSISIWLGKELAWTNYGYRGLYAGTYQSGWNDFFLSMQGCAVGGAGIDWTVIRYIRFQVDNRVGSPAGDVIVYFDLIEFYPIRAKGIYVLTLDDGRADQMEFLGYCAAKGIQCSVCVNPKLLGSSSTFMTVDQLKGVRDQGHLVCNHGYEHRYPSDGYSYQQCLDDVLRGQDWLMDNGFADGARILALPGGGGSWKRDSVGFDYRDWLGKYCDVIRTAGGGLAVCDTPDYNVLDTGCFDSASAAATNLDLAKDGGGVTVVGVHSPTVLATWKSHIDTVKGYIDAGTIETATLADVWEK